VEKQLLSCSASGMVKAIGVAPVIASAASSSMVASSIFRVVKASSLPLSVL